MAVKAHIRSNSFPSRTHPVNDNVEEQLLWLRSSEAASTSSSISSVCQKLGGLKDLLDSIDDWLQLSHTQQVLSNENRRKCVEDLLDGSLRTLDVCGTLRDVLSHMKGCIRELESSFRRKREVDLGLTSEVESYIMSRKKMRKLISKTLESLKKMEKQSNQNKAAEEDDEAALDVLREVQQINISVFESLLCFLSGKRTRSNGWSMGSKVMSAKRISCQAAADANEVEALDSELVALKSSKVNGVQVRAALKQAEALQSVIQEIEEVLECIFRCLVKTRVSLLNSISY
ncbi:uncharacterized protein LOC116214545 [Punica granatum]|uniref:Uncharacterized protein n=2 Tax=Punica granatum TaxID=22663 RepID=A0A218WEW5_PUNGR|nr:uncharacterized protein LOC116214545 [Punica granatum]OWM70602.1 hypothetical protein CDL15_Pgr014275 [Punica granatum]PKI55141.1 hypothetical protein CRG98_024432 [Punica granatum]